MPGGEPGSEVSRGGFLQNQLLQGQVGDRSTEALVLCLRRLQPLDLVTLQTAVLGTPAIISDFRHLDGSNYW